MMIRQGVDEKKTKSNHSNLAVKFTPLPSEASKIVPISKIAMSRKGVSSKIHFHINIICLFIDYVI